MSDDREVTVLRRKYRDYCSSRVADALVSLTPDEFYTLAQAEADSRSNPGPQSYNEAVELATRRIRAQLDLPDFKTWAEDYRQHPEQYDPHLLGLWETEEDTSER